MSNCTTSIKNAIDRARARGEKTGRVVPIKEIRSIHRAVSNILPQIASEFDNVKLYDTSERGKAVLIAEGGGGKPLTVYNKKLYARFTAKGKEKK